MSSLERLEQEREQGRQQVERFVYRFESSYRRLAYYAALPLILTPELLNYLRTLLLQEVSIPWVAEVDLLLSDLCRPMGYEQYAMESAARSYLLSQMEQELGQERLEEVARLLISYVRQIAHTNPFFSQQEIRSQQWAAMVYLEDQRENAVKQIAEAFQVVASPGNAASAVARQQEFAHLAQLTQELEAQLQGYENLLEYARLVGRVLENPDEVDPAVLSQSFEIVEGISLRVPTDLISGQAGHFSNLPGVQTFEFEVATISFDGISDSSHPIELQPFEFTLATLKYQSIGDVSDEKPEDVISTDSQSLTTNEILRQLNAAVYQHSGQHLNDLEVRILQGALQNQTYTEIFLNDAGYSESYIKRDVAPKLWKLLSEVLGEKVGKKNLQEVAERCILQRSQTSREDFLQESRLGEQVDDESIEIAFNLREDDSPSLSLEEALKVCDEAVYQYSGQHLKDVEAWILRGALQNQTYTEIFSNDPGYSESYIKRDVAPKLWKLLSEALREPVRKMNLLESLRRYRDRQTQQQSGIVLEHRQMQAWQFVEDLEELEAGVHLEMVAIPGGSFVMGSPEDELERSPSESPQHSVTVPPFLMGKYPITQAQWRAIASLPSIVRELNPDPSHFKGDSRPVECVSWLDALEFCDRLTQLTGRPYRLPSEAEWEYACRAGTPTPFHFGESITTDLANYDGNYTYGRGPTGVYRQETTPVGSFGVAGSTHL